MATESHIAPAALEWRDATPVSARFGDVYFSPEDGLAETRHVFLGGTRLPEAWRGRELFAVGETGFGTGLNFLATWQAWRADPERCRRLHFVSVEGFPLTRPDLARALASWPELGDMARALAEAWPGPQAGFHRLEFEGGAVALTLLMGPVAAVLPDLEARIDAWFLDGFAPARNPEMWSEAVFAQLARLSQPGARLATFTAAGAVRRGLEAVGFRTEKAPGFGRKREMLRAAFGGPPGPSTLPPWFRPPPTRPAGHALIVGGGVAGAWMADALHRRGWRATVLERHAAPAREGSGNPAGIVMPGLVMGHGPERRFHAQAYLYALHRLRGAPAFHGCGVLDLAGKPQAAEAGLLPEEELRAVSAAEATRIAGVPIRQAALWLPGGGWLAAPEQIGTLLAQADLRREAPVGRLERTGAGWLARAPDGTALAEADVAILAGALDSRLFAQADWLPLVPRRGQLTLIPASEASRALRCVLAGPAYLTPPVGGRHVTGATFDVVPDRLPAPAQPVLESDHARNLGRLSEMLPGLFPADTPASGGRAALRATTPDHLPLAGPLPDRGRWLEDYAGLRTGNRRIRYPDAALQDGLWVLSGLGARGLVTAPLAAATVAAALTGEPWPVPRDVAGALHPGRMIVRALRTRQL